MTRKAPRSGSIAPPIDYSPSGAALDHDPIRLNRIMIASFCWSMISGQTLRVCPEGKPVPTPHQVRGRLFPDHALESRDRLRRLAGAERAQRRGVAVDPLLDDLAGPDAEFVDAAPAEPLTVDDAGGLPLDDHPVAARGPVQQLPDEIRRRRGLHFHQTVEFASRDRPVHQ